MGSRGNHEDDGEAKVGGCERVVYIIFFFHFCMMLLFCCCVYVDDYDFDDFFLKNF